ncbi:PREDICTED: THAP domain-containing protein 5 [Ceratosolen solmsi marchali]|uniref:THAP domain-containing protein 5 n=1 Tax=Ceratosolen solmsi marchali TaxID=326594 RepID=A0AAJ7DZS0_9HYME|nr:PREDICTED: THAP domain-containing protein 5 [Ceratosolen solmsi marchali]
MENMQACCLEGCESYKYITKQKIGYFKFPTRNKPLLQKWLSQIRIPNWLPTDNHRICSRHFHIDDIDFSHKQPKLKTNAIPMIFPLKHFQNIYIDKINTNAIQGMKTNVYLNKIESTHQIIMSNPNSILHNPTKSSSMVLLCTPTEESNNISNLQISSLSTSNISMKKIPIKNDLMKCCNSKSPKLSTLNPYVLIISDNKEPKIPFKNVSTKKTHAILKLQIDKKLNTITPNNLIIDSVVEENRFNIIKRNNNNVLNTSSMEEIEVDDISSTKIVVFKFDSSTGKITVLKKEKFEKNTEISRETIDVKQSFKFDIIKDIKLNINFKQRKGSIGVKESFL